jgi:nucleoside-diphosphate-sugar epimerase
MNVSGKRVLVTGGTGFLGSSLVRSLLRAGAIVRSLDDDSRGSSRRLRDIEGKVELIRGDIRNAEDVASAIAGVDCVCHLAYLNGTEFFYSRPDLVLEIAVKGMMNVIEGCIKHGVRDLVLASSSEVYQTPPTVPTDEAAPLIIPDPFNPRYSYGGGKLISELLAINYGRKHFDRVVIFRPHNVYGPDMGREHVVPQLSLRLIELARTSQGPIDLPIQGTGEETRAFVYIDDLSDAVMRTIQQGQHLSIYHVGTDHEVTITELATEIGRCLGRVVRVIPGTLQPGSTLRRCPDISKIRALGYQPRVPLSEGLARTVRWYVENEKSNEQASESASDKFKKESRV